MDCTLFFNTYTPLLSLTGNSRPSKTAEWDYDFFVDFNAVDNEQVRSVAKSLEPFAKQVHIVGPAGASG